MNFEEFLESLKEDVGPTLENSVHEYTSKAAIEKINTIYPIKDKYVWDVGCGLGRDCYHFASLGAERVIGTTINFEEYKKVLEQPKPTSLDFYFEDMHLDEGDTPFWDIIFMSHVLEHSPCPLLVLKQKHLVLRDDGILYIEVPSPQPWSIHNQNHYSIFCKDMWLELFYKAGFVCIEQTNLKINIETDTGKIEDEFWGFILKKKNA